MASLKSLAIILGGIAAGMGRAFDVSRMFNGGHDFRGPTPSRKGGRRFNVDVGSHYPGAKLARKAANSRLTVMH